jgi:hypothetical protein
MAETVGRYCLCNGLIASIGLGQRRAGSVEPPIVTIGQDLSFLPKLLPPGRQSYTAADVVAYLLQNDQPSDRRSERTGGPEVEDVNQAGRGREAVGPRSSPV